MKLKFKIVMNLIFILCMFFMSGVEEVQASDGVPYTLTDYDVVVTDGVITSVSYPGSMIPEPIIIPDTLDGQTVTGIGNNAFELRYLAGVTIPDTVTSIGDNAFCDNYITSLTIPSSVTSIGDGAFCGNVLTSVTISNSATSISNTAFSQQGSNGFTGSWYTTTGEEFLFDAPRSNNVTIYIYPELYTITLDEKGGEAINDLSGYNLTVYAAPFTTKAGYTFEGWYEDEAYTTEVSFPYTITADDTWYAKWTITPYTLNDDDVVVSGGEIKSYNYSGADPEPTSIIIPDTLDGQTVTSIGLSAFREKQLTSISIPNSVTKLGYYAFYNNLLTSVNIPNSVTYIDYCAFGSNKLTSVSIPNSVTYLARFAFYQNELTHVEIPDSLTNIDEYTFSENKLTSVIIPDGVTNIDQCAFKYNQLTSVTIPNSVISIGAEAFNNNQLTSVSIPNSVTSIGDNAFKDNQLTSITIPNSITSIDNGVFQNNQLISVTIPDSITSIGNNAFCNNYLTNLTIPNSVTSIGSGAFYNNQLTSIVIPEGVTTIEQKTFEKNKLTAIEIPDSVTSIGYRAFSDNELTSVVIPNSVTSIGAEAFNNNQLISVDIPSSVTRIDYCAFNNNQLTTVTIPDSVTEISANVFSYNLLIRVDIPSSVTSIGYMAFYDNQLTTVEIPNSVISISDVAFASNRLKSVTIKSSQTTIAENSFVDQYPPEGYNSFIGWYESSEFSGEQFDFTATRGDNITIYAKYSPYTYNIYLYEMVGEEASVLEEVYGTIIDTVPSVTTREGYTFEGWYEEEDYTTPVVFPHIVTHYDTWYAKWTSESTPVETYTVTFDSNGGATVSAITVNANATIIAPTAPTKTGYTFEGWYKESTLTNEWNFATDIVTSDITLYAKWAPVSSGSSSGSSSSNKNIVKGETGESSFNIGEKQTTYNDGKKEITVKVDEKLLQNQVNKVENSSTISIPVAGNADIAKAELNVQDVKNMQDKDLVLEIETDNATYELPTNQIDVEDISEKIGKDIELSHISFSVAIFKTKNEMVKVVETATEEKGLAIAVSPVDFEIEAVYKDKSCKVDKFNSFVKRMVEIPKETDVSKITTAIITEKDGSIRHVPTYIKEIDGKYYATINSLTNSTYSLIYNEVAFSDVKDNHWAKADIEKMASRLVVEGKEDGVFSPNVSITRAELAQILVKSLGLKPVEVDQFVDVESGTEYAGYIGTAYSYGIIKGTSEITFDPESLVTRQDAMIMIYKAGIIAGLGDAEAITDMKGYVDYKDVSDYAKEAVAWSVNNGIIIGKTDTTLVPLDNITRAELSVVINKLLMSAGLIE